MATWARLPLALLVLGVATTDNPNDSPPTDDFTVLTNRFDATAHLHFSTLTYVYGRAYNDSGTLHHPQGEADQSKVLMPEPPQAPP